MVCRHEIIIITSDNWLGQYAKHIVFSSSCFQPGEGPCWGLLCDYTISNIVKVRFKLYYTRSLVALPSFK